MENLIAKASSDTIFATVNVCCKLRVPLNFVYMQVKGMCGLFAFYGKRDLSSLKIAKQRLFNF